MRRSEYRAPPIPRASQGPRAASPARAPPRPHTPARATYGLVWPHREGLVGREGWPRTAEQPQPRAGAQRADRGVLRAGYLPPPSLPPPPAPGPPEAPLAGGQGGALHLDGPALWGRLSAPPCGDLCGSKAVGLVPWAAPAVPPPFSAEPPGGQHAPLTPDPVLLPQLPWGAKPQVLLSGPSASWALPGAPLCPACTPPRPSPAMLSRVRCLLIT